MKIIRVEGKVEKSIVDDMQVSGLPAELQAKLVRLLGKLKGVKSIHISEGVQEPIFELADKHVDLEYFSVQVREEFQKTINLLEWYLKPHWYGIGRRGAIGGTTYCVDCQTGEIVGSGSGYCGNSDCASHEKWREVIGDSYQAPPRPAPFNFPKVELQG